MGENCPLMCVCVYICCPLCVSLHHTHPSLQPFATWPVNYLFLFTHAHKENKPLSDCLDRLHSPSPPPFQHLFLPLSSVDTRQPSLPKIRQAFISFGQGQSAGRVKLNSAALQWETLTGLHKTSGSERSLLKLSGNWFECWVHRQNNIDLWRFHIRGKSIFQFSRIKHYISHSPAQCYSRGCLAAAAAAAGLLAMLSSPETQWIVFTYTCTSHCALLIKMADFFGSEMLSR